MSFTPPPPISPVMPRDVPGYSEAVTSGAVTLPPNDPPSLLSGRSSQELLHRFVALCFGGLAGLLALMKSLPVIVGDGIATVLMLLAFGVVAMMAGRAWQGVTQRNLEEFAAGYTTMRLLFGALGGDRNAVLTSPYSVKLRVPWDYSGLWVLAPKSGAVVTAPDRSKDAPGYYPSPNFPGDLELWSGVMWTGGTRRAA